MSGAEVQWGVCIGFRAGLPFSVFLSEIFEWDQTVIRSKLALKQTHTHIVVLIHSHAQLYLAYLKVGCREGWVYRNGVAPVNGATPKEVSGNSLVVWFEMKHSFLVVNSKHVSHFALCKGHSQHAQCHVDTDSEPLFWGTQRPVFPVKGSAMAQGSKKLKWLPGREVFSQQRPPPPQQTQAVTTSAWPGDTPWVNKWGACQSAHHNSSETLVKEDLDMLGFGFFQLYHCLYRPGQITLHLDLRKRMTSTLWGAFHNCDLICFASLSLMLYFHCITFFGLDTEEWIWDIQLAFINDIYYPAKQIPS